MKNMRNLEGADEKLARVRYLAEHVERLSSRVLTVTAPIVQEDARGELELVGSSVLISFAEARFLVTANHVLSRRQNNTLFVGVSPEIVEVTGQSIALCTTGAQSETEDHVDIGIVRLEGEAWASVSSRSFASWPELDVRPPVLARQSYALTGFPYSYNKKMVEHLRLNAIAYKAIGLECTEVAYQCVGRNPTTNLMVGFDRNAMWGEQGIKTAPDLYGVSGSGLWRFGRRVRDATSAPLLSAIAIEWQKKGRNRHVLGTRMPVVIEAMVNTYDDVRAFVDEQDRPVV